ncbi:MAG: hypothetical protein ACM3OF_14485 [Gemmatimonas sp.]
MYPASGDPNKPPNKFGGLFICIAASTGVGPHHSPLGPQARDHSVNPPRVKVDDRSSVGSMGETAPKKPRLLQKRNGFPRAAGAMLNSGWGAAVMFDVYLNGRRDLLVVRKGFPIPRDSASSRWRKKKRVVSVSEEIRRDVQKQGYYVRKLNTKRAD